MKESSSIEGVGRRRRCAFKYKEKNLGVLYYVGWGIPKLRGLTTSPKAHHLGNAPNNLRTSGIATYGQWTLT
jgi:hypothetical protein